MKVWYVNLQITVSKYGKIEVYEAILSYNIMNEWYVIWGQNNMKWWNQQATDAVVELQVLLLSKPHVKILLKPLLYININMTHLLFNT